MYIEDTADEKLVQTLTFGSFPKNVLQYQESQLFFEQIVFIDYQLQLLIQNEFGGDELVPLRAEEEETLDSNTEKLNSLREYALSISANYNDQSKSYRESLFFVCVMAQLYYLNNQPRELSAVLGTIHVPLDNNNNISSQDVPGEEGEYDELLRYLTTRYKVLQGISGIVNELEPGHEPNLSGPYVWNEYLLYWRALFNKSNVAANHWLDILYDKFTNVLGAEGLNKIEFQLLCQQTFSKNHYSMVSLSNYLCRSTNKHKINSNFKQDYSAWLMTLLETKMVKNSRLPFINANQIHSEFNTFTDNLFEGLSNVSYYYTVLKPLEAKRFLVYCSSKTYQSQTIISNLIKTLIDLNEYDEAFAAMKTYIRYLEMEQEQHGGHVDNVLSIIDTYTSCILAFNPLDKKKAANFKYTSNQLVVELLEDLSSDLIRYLGVLAKTCELTYDGPIEKDSLSKNGNAHDHDRDGDDYDDDESKDVEEDVESGGKEKKVDDLSFLYRKYNLNLLLTDRSLLIDIISKAWFSLGRFYLYFTIHATPTEKKLNEYISKVLYYYKNALIVNSTGNVEILFNYALGLANNGSLLSASKLCKFILKKYPESFKTWNLLVLILTSFEQSNPEHTAKASTNGSTNATTAATENTATTTATSTTDARVNSSAPSTTIHESEKFIGNALNIAALFIDKYIKAKGSIKLSFETKYHIIQLKLTQLAVWESIYGIHYILEFLPDLFGLFHELFEFSVPVSTSAGVAVSTGNGPSATANGATAAVDNAWSHRPSFIDPKIPNGNKRDSYRKKKSHEIEHISEKLKSLSRTTSAKHPQSRTKSINGGASTRSSGTVGERKLLQDLWLWASTVYSKIGNLEQAEECIVEAETVYESNIKTYSSLGFLTSKTRKFLALQEFEKSLEKLSQEQHYNKRDYGYTLLGLCKLFLIDDKLESSLFISSTDLDAGILRLKNYLEKFTLCWPYGYNQPEVWWYLSLIYERLDDKLLLNKSLWRSIELEDYRPVRDFTTSVIES